MKGDVAEGWTPEELERGNWWYVWIWLKYTGFVYDSAEEEKKTKIIQENTIVLWANHHRFNLSAFIQVGIYHI